jgi:hypothetical protein
MTKEELIARAVAEAAKAQWHPKRVFEATRDGYNGKPYAFETTPTYKAAVDLYEATHMAAPPPPPPPPDNSLARSWLILGQDPELALNSPWYYKLAVTADPAYRQFLTSSFLNSARAQGRTIFSWCDSKPSGGTPPSVAIQVMRDYGLDGWMGEGESAAAFDNVLAHNGKVAVVNLSALRPDQLQAIKERRILVTVELYRNCNGAQQPDWKNVNEGVGGNCIAVYRDSQCGGMSLQRYLADGMFVGHRDSVYGPQCTADDYRQLP